MRHVLDALERGEAEHLAVPDARIRKAIDTLGAPFDGSVISAAARPGVRVVARP